MIKKKREDKNCQFQECKRGITTYPTYNYKK